MDFILNGEASGNVANTLLKCNFNPNGLRPWVGADGREYLAQVRNGKPVAVPVRNANATLRKDEWQLLDTAVIKAAKERLKAVTDLTGMGLTYNIPNGMGTTVLQTQAQSDIGDAIMSMDGLRQGDRDRPQFNLTNLPLPIIHKDFSFSARQIATSRNSGAALDTSMAELAGRRVAEFAEKLLIGNQSAYKYGGGEIYGYRNFPNRITGSVTSPAASGWTPSTLVTEVLAMRQQAKIALHYGPYKLYLGTAWDQYLDEDYSSQKGTNTLRQRLGAIDSILEVSSLDYLSGFEVILVQMTSDVVREVIGMNITTVQWPSAGGLQTNYKVMAIMVPQLRADYNGNTGIVHATV